MTEDQRLPTRTIGHAVRLIATLVVGGLAATLLVTMAPGFGVDERELDPRRNADSIALLRLDSAPESPFWSEYLTRLKGYTQGDWGFSRSLNRPVAGLIRERLPLTAQVVLTGLLIGWTGGLALASAAALYPGSAARSAAGAFTSASLCLPAAVLAFGFALLNAPAGLAVGAVILPRVYRYADNLFRAAGAKPYVIAARARGLSGPRVFTHHVALNCIPELLALAGATVTIACGAAIPIEVVSDTPGLGQLAWKAALGRDLPVVTAATLLMTGASLAGHSVADALMARRNGAFA